jgi:hypothetical protein
MFFLTRIHPGIASEDSEHLSADPVGSERVDKIAKANEGKHTGPLDDHKNKFTLTASRSRPWQRPKYEASCNARREAENL